MTIDPIMQRAYTMAARAAVAVLVSIALAAGAAHAAAQSTEPNELVRRNVPAMASPKVATLQMSTGVSGVLASPEAGQPLGGYDLHFQNRMGGNLYTVRTEANGAFWTMLPQGVYDLRGMYGTAIVRGLTVGSSPVNLGPVNFPGPYNVWQLFERQEVGEAIVESPAPATARLPSGSRLPIAVKPISSPPVMGAGTGGQRLAPVEVIPSDIYQQTVIPPGADVSMPGAAPPPEETPPAPRGGY